MYPLCSPPFLPPCDLAASKSDALIFGTSPTYKAWGGPLPNVKNTLNLAFLIMLRTAARLKSLRADDRAGLPTANLHSSFPARLRFNDARLLGPFHFN